MEFIGEAHLDVAEDNYKVVPLRDFLLLIGPHYVNIIKLGDSVWYSLQLDDNKRNIIRYLPASNKILHVGKDNTVQILSPTHQGVFVLGDILNDSSVRLSFQESMYLLETLQDSDLNWGPDTEDILQRVAFLLQQRIPELQHLPLKKQPWSECVLEGSYAELEPLFEDLSSQPFDDPVQRDTISKLLLRLKRNSIQHSKHPSTSPVVSVAVSATEEVAVTGASDGSISIWDISNGVILMNTIPALAGLTEVLLGEELISIHHPNTVVVHQIGEQALSETLFQHEIEGATVMGASYVAATRTLVLVLNDVIGSPAKADYYLQSASVNIEDRTLELGDRVRVEGAFVAIASTSGTNTLSITQDGFVVLYDSSSSTISNSFKKPESTYRFSDITSYNGFVYATTLGGTVLSFNLANITERSSEPTSPFTPPSPRSPVASAFQGFSAASEDDPFAQSKQLDGDGDDFGTFSSAQQGGEDDFGTFSSAQKGGDDDGFGTFSSAQESNLGDNDDFGFGDFNAAASSSVPPTDSNTNQNTTNGTPPKSPQSGFDEFGFEPSLSPSGTPQSTPPKAEFSPKFSLDAPGVGIAGSVAAHNSSTGDFGELPRVGSNQNSPVIGASKLRQSRDVLDFPESPYSSPSLQRKAATTLPTTDMGDFSEFSAGSSPAVESSSPHAEPFSNDLNATTPPRSPQKLTETNFGDFGTHNQFGDFGSAQNSSTGSLGGDFGSQGSLGDFGAIPPPQPNGHSSSPTQLGDFGDLSSGNQQTSDDFGDFSTQQSNTDFGDLSASSTSLHASAGLPASTPTTPSLLSTQIQGSGSLFPTSPSIFSIDAFSALETPPPVQLSQSGAHSPSPLRQTSSSHFDDFGGDFGSAVSQSPPTQRVQTPTLVNTPPRSPLQVAQTSPQHRQPTPTLIDTFEDTSSKQESLGDFGEFSATTPQTENKGDFGDLGDFSPSTTQQEQFSSDFGGDFGENPAVTIPTGDVGQSVESATSQSEGDFGELSATPAVQQDTFDEFGEAQPADATQQNDDGFGDFGEKPITQTDFSEAQPADVNQQNDDDFGDFGEKPASSATEDEDFGDFGERPTASSTEGFGDIGESPAAPQATATDDFGDFGESDSAPAQTTSAEDDFGDFGAMAGEGKKEGEEEDDFGDFGDFSAPGQATGGDDDFGDFGDFSAADQSSADFGDFEAPSDFATEPVPTPAPAVPATPAPAPVAVPSTPSVFSLDDKELSSVLTSTFSSAFSSLIPSSSASSPPSSPSTRSALMEGLDLDATLKTPGASRTQACPRCGIMLCSANPSSCLACGATVGTAAPAWSGIVLPPIAEIKFWDALGVSIKSMTEKPKEPAALSSSQGILSPAVLTPSTSQTSIPATQPSLSSSWDFNENPFSPGRVSGAPAIVPTSTTTATTTSAASARIPASHAQPSAQGLASATSASANASAANAATHASQAPTTQAFADFSSFGSSSSSSSPFSVTPSSSTPPSSSSPTSTFSRQDDDFFLSFNPSSSSTPAAPAKSPSLSATSTPSSHPWTQFINRIPDLSFVVADKLVIPSH